MKLTEIKDLKLAYHSSLNPRLWVRQGDEFILKPKVKEKLIEIANKFAESLMLVEPMLTEYVITGSNANFNWTKQSDLDIHLLIDAERLKNCKTCKVDSEDCLQAKKTLWNDRHDITIYDIPVEVYVTTAAEKLVQDAGTYSLSKDMWIKKPQKKEISIDAEQIKAKATEISKEIDQLIDQKSDDEAVIKELLDKISRMRQAGISSAGEFSVENLAFKALRNNGYIDKIRTYAVKAQDDVLSLKDDK